MSIPDPLAELLCRARPGAWAPLARAVTLVENAPPWTVTVPVAASPCHIIGITGPPGAGKSTLTGRLIEAFSDAGRRVAVVAIDPSSPISGGAVLGDRLRMETHLQGRPQVFVRSLASRGSHGAVASSTRNVARLLEASGLFDVILIETVGAGQTEVAIVDVADSVILVTVPGLGDAVQAIKAGLMEVADLFVVNMADRPGAAETLRHLRLAAGDRGRVLATVAVSGEGVPALVDALENRWCTLAESDQLAQSRQRSWTADASLVAQAWVASRASAVDVTETRTVTEAVARILKEARQSWQT